LKPASCQQIYTFAKNYFDYLGIESDRTKIRELQGVGKYIIEPASKSFDFNQMSMIASSAIIATEINKDNLLEL
jgi:hypothetical protein